MAKELEKANEAKDGVTSLKNEAYRRDVTEVQVLELSNQIISEIFYNIVTLCKAAAKAK